MDHPIIQKWRGALTALLRYYDHKRTTVRRFPLKLFGVLFLVNVACYYWAMATAFPELMFGDRAAHYVKMTLPIGVLAAFFEMGSVYITVFLIRRALAAPTTSRYFAHLFFDVTADLAIGVAAAAWVIFSFGFSSWLVNYTTLALTGTPSYQQKAPPKAKRQRPRPPNRNLAQQPAQKRVHKRKARRSAANPQARLKRIRGTAKELQEKRDFAVWVIQESLRNPLHNWRNFYFGTVLGASELLPTLLHLFFALRALGHLLVRALARLRPLPT